MAGMLPFKAERGASRSVPLAAAGMTWRRSGTKSFLVLISMQVHDSQRRPYKVQIVALMLDDSFMHFQRASRQIALNHQETLLPLVTHTAAARATAKESLASMWLLDSSLCIYCVSWIFHSEAKVWSGRFSHVSYIAISMHQYFTGHCESIFHNYR